MIREHWTAPVMQQATILQSHIVAMQLQHIDTIAHYIHSVQRARIVVTAFCLNSIAHIQSQHISIICLSRHIHSIAHQCKQHLALHVSWSTARAQVSTLHTDKTPSKPFNHSQTASHISPAYTAYTLHTVNINSYPKTFKYTTHTLM